MHFAGFKCMSIVIVCGFVASPCFPRSRALLGNALPRSSASYFAGVELKSACPRSVSAVEAELRESAFPNSSLGTTRMPEHRR